MQSDITRSSSFAQVGIVTQSFTWMCVGLVVTAVTALIVASNQLIAQLVFANSLVFFGLLIAELILVGFLSLRITKMSYEAAIVSFAFYSALNGVTLSLIFLAYTATSIASTFFITAGVFAIMATYGYTTKKDLTTVGHLAFMGLIGIILASFVNFFLKNDAFSYIISYISIAIFIGLTAYDTQKIKALEARSNLPNLGILGALTLYLDFVNLFLNILRILGKRRN